MLRAVFRRDDADFARLGVRGTQLSLWAKRGYIRIVKRGLYVFVDMKDAVDQYTIAFLVYEPSYISLESALKHYGLIPEMVQAVTSVTPRTTRSFTNEYGRFIYRHIRSDLFWGYRASETTHGKYLMAEPEKAVLDYMYFNLRVLGTIDDIRALRINTEEFRKAIDRRRFKKYLAAFDSPKMNHAADLLLHYVDA